MRPNSHLVSSNAVKLRPHHIEKLFLYWLVRTIDEAKYGEVVVAKDKHMLDVGGYGETVVDKENEVLERIHSDSDLTIEVVSEFDTFCKLCPGYISGVKRTKCNQYGQAGKEDADAIRKYGLDVGRTYGVEELQEMFKNKLPELMASDRTTGQL